MSPKASPPLAVAQQLEMIGQRVAGIRLSRNMTQKDLAEQVGTTRHTVMRLEKGEATTLETFIRVLTGLGLADNLSVLLPDPSVRPVDRVRLQGNERQRARPNSSSPQKASDWAWGEEIDE